MEEEETGKKGKARGGLAKLRVTEFQDVDGCRETVAQPLATLLSPAQRHGALQSESGPIQEGPWGGYHLGRTVEQSWGPPYL